MAEPAQETGNTKKTATKAGRKSSSKSAAKRKSPASKTKSGRGADRLRSAVNSLLDEQCGRIAKALVDNTIAGNMSGARLLVALADPKTPPEKMKKKRRGPSLAQRLAAEPPWQGPDEENEFGYNGDPDTL